MGKKKRLALNWWVQVLNEIAQTIYVFDFE